MDEEMEEIIGSFSFSKPFPKNPRVLSLRGIIPQCNAPEYELFDKFLWELVRLDQVSNSPIILVLHSFGGNVESLISFCDFTSMISSPLYTIAQQAYSGAGIMLVCGTYGHRYVFPSTMIILHNAHATTKCLAHNGENNTPYSNEKETENSSKCRNCKLIERSLAITNHEVALLLDERTRGRFFEFFDGANAPKHKPSAEKRARRITAILKEDRLLTATEAIACGVADKIITPEIFHELFYPKAQE